MGAEAKQEKVKAEAKPEEEKKEEPKPPSPFVLFVDLHCVGCAKKIEKSILNIAGVEGVEIDMLQNQVTIKGVVEPQAVCAKIMKKTKRRARVLSPLPASEGEPIPEVVNSQVSGLTTVELNVNMHCEACAEQLKRKILKMKGVTSATTDLSSMKVTVTGTMDGDNLVDYVYRRTKKQAKIVPQPEPEPKPEQKKEAEKPAEEPKPEDKKEEGEGADKKQEGEKPPEEEKKEGGGENESAGKEEAKINEAAAAAGGEEQIINSNIVTAGDEQALQRMMYYYQPVYVMERIPPPQLFSDENPNACCIT
ncbi:hypothetical protein Vadar_031584 [Vaccinium darrowii]|uniref:Uncharacterized protein n=1 Tax=Vaccinium darrowii TaxID=229202 RepID=A0ACB7YQW4_9ERIC|nr:hypothetical protein Vadar_031584 [Vaccinium darrowii]